MNCVARFLPVFFYVCVCVFFELNYIVLKTKTSNYSQL